MQELSGITRTTGRGKGRWALWSNCERLEWAAGEHDVLIVADDWLINEKEQIDATSFGTSATGRMAAD